MRIEIRCLTMLFAVICTSAPPTAPTYLHPRKGEFYGPALIMGGGGNHGRR